MPPMPRLLVLSAGDVTALLPAEACLSVMARALTDLQRGRSFQPLRFLVRPPDAPGFIGLMPAHTSSPVLKGVEGPVGGSAYGLKAVCVVPDNPSRGLDSHQGGVLLSDGTTGELLAVMNATAITAIRTAAVTALGVKALSRPDACDLALIGAGHQAGPHLEAVSRVRALRRVRVVSANPAGARAFAERHSGAYPFPIEATASVEEAVAGADLVVAVSSARTPILFGRWLSPGTHVALVGACVPTAREADAAVMARGTLFVDRIESALNESGDILLAIAEGALPPDPELVELGAVLAGAHPGRASADEITVLKTLGLAVEDLAAAAYLYCEAKVRGAGSWIEF